MFVIWTSAFSNFVPFILGFVFKNVRLIICATMFSRRVRSFRWNNNHMNKLKINQSPMDICVEQFCLSFVASVEPYVIIR